MTKELKKEIKTYENLIRKGADQKYIDNQMKRVIETIKEEITEKIKKFNKLLSESRGYNKQLDDSFPSIEKVFKEIIRIINKRR